MLRRDVSRALLVSGALSGLGLVPARAQRVSFQEGRDYHRLPQSIPTDAPAGQVEVRAFFAYNCGHCHQFEPLLEEWAPMQTGVLVRRTPVAFGSAHVPLQHLYYALEAMDLVRTLHTRVFRAIFEERVSLSGEAAILAWVRQQGVDVEQFARHFRSPDVAALARKAAVLQDGYQIDGTPALGIAGRFFISGQGPRTLLVADSLIRQARVG